MENFSKFTIKMHLAKWKSPSLHISSIIATYGAKHMSIRNSHVAQEMPVHAIGCLMCTCTLNPHISRYIRTYAIYVHIIILLAW